VMKMLSDMIQCVIGKKTPTAGKSFWQLVCSERYNVNLNSHVKVA
jgi:hypothetical protein